MLYKENFMLEEPLLMVNMQVSRGKTLILGESWKFVLTLKRPGPIDNFGLVNAEFKGMIGIFDNLVLQPLFDMRPGYLELGNPVNDIYGKIKPVYLVLYGQLQGCVDITFFFIAPNVQILMIGTPVSQLVNEPGVAVKIKNNRFVQGKQAIKIPMAQAVRVFRRVLQAE